MKLTLEINEFLWQSDLNLFNVTQTAQVDRINEQGAAQHARIMAQTPESRRTDFVPIPDFIPITLDQYVVNALKAKEAAIESAQDAVRDKVILAASKDDKARIVKIFTQSDKMKDAIRSQVDAL